MRRMSDLKMGNPVMIHLRSVACTYWDLLYHLGENLEVP